MDMHVGGGDRMRAKKDTEEGSRASIFFPLYTCPAIRARLSQLVVLRRLS